MSANYSVYERLPRWAQWVTVEASSVHSLGFLDPHGLWRDARDGHIIESVESWSPLNNEENEVRRDDFGVYYRVVLFRTKGTTEGGRFGWSTPFLSAGPRHTC